MRAAREAPRPLWKRLAWMLAIWAASVLALGLAALVMRFLMRAVGLTY